MEHFLKLLKSCPLRTGEIVHKLVVARAKVLPTDKKTRYLLKNYRQLHGISERGGPASETQEVEPLVCGYEEPQPPTIAGMAPPKTASRTESVAAADEGLAEGSRSNTRVASLQQASIKRWVDNDAQKKLDIVWAEAMFRAGIAFNFLNFDTAQKLHEVYLEVANARPEVKLLHIQKQVHPLTTCWDESGCTFITDGSSDRQERPIVNFLATGEKGAFLVATVSMTARKKTAQALAKLWERIMREIEVHRINAICTNNVKNAMRYLQRQVGGAWKGPDHLEVLGDLHEFHKAPTPKGPKRKDKKMWEPEAKADCEKLTPSEWWATYGNDVPDLQAIAIKVMGMWSTATPVVRVVGDLWRNVPDLQANAIKVMGMRNNLQPETLQKLVYIHWNMQLLRVANNSGANGEGYVDLWSSFFEAIPKPDENDGSILKAPKDETEKTDEELVRRSTFVNTPKGKIPKKLEDEEDERTDDSDLDDELWKGKCDCRMRRAALSVGSREVWLAHSTGAACGNSMYIHDDDLDRLLRGAVRRVPCCLVRCRTDELDTAKEEGDESDSDFESGAQPSVPNTTYVGRREVAGRRREKQPVVSARAKGESSSQYHPQSYVEFHHVHTDIELLLQSAQVDEDEAKADRAKALADRDRDVVQKQIMEEDAQHAAIPTRREIERRKKKVGEKEPETHRPLDVVQEREKEEQQQSEAVLKVAEVALQEEEDDRVQPKKAEEADLQEPEEKDQQEDKDDMEQQQGEEMEHKEEYEEMEHEEDEEGMESQGEEEAREQQEDAQSMDQQNMQHNVDEEDDE
ncbi:hypothetical protein CBR_g38453 [Chara braunii]|uniref:DUF659 domain-containing protein n=1 Tax=Chara braunii TaxID=69332 RepID=A0A388JNS5_CHABU|nr:hypothetical protein CBR_g38453 [Chara braunii]|eukprot:GBG59428.1 hypothetical protein CBR_g38453 [Chara braunii]